MSSSEIRRIPADETRGLRRAVLRPHQPPEAVVYPGDDDKDTLHLGLYAEGRLLGVASLYREPPPYALKAITAWRLRGMAVEQGRQGQGLGAALLKACMEHAVTQKGTQLWCNARSTASGFYRSLGFVQHGDAFELPGIGPHHLMSRNLAESAR
ncbi:GNAT family N-acetyltransferase [Myxococcus sp. CA051A]|uniref:GNAT family N-acetyltransferase n=1 Tax=unclassified Myxococcus TaxID=2648731 RepID=UPI00157BAB22|nr:GNAT family N-acetyltransferase [Myxococcus sp. CA033]NTX55088.1 GNAT family N-acetyltransferase [Myxococcus sp. CA039A]NTX66635.1 GNAT family N-acetyltransferase [Myxococcus sp. CA051A]